MGLLPALWAMNLFEQKLAAIACYQSQFDEARFAKLKHFVTGRAEQFTFAAQSVQYQGLFEQLVGTQFRQGRRA